MTPDSYAWPQIDNLRKLKQQAAVDAAAISVLKQALRMACAEINELKGKLS